MRLAVTIFSVLLLVLCYQLASAWPELPDQMATHFNAAGEADGWMSKGGFVIFYAAMIALMVLTFAGLGALMPRLPDSLINLPNKEQWLAPEHRAKTFAVLQSQMLWIGNATLLFFAVLFHLVVQANLDPGEARLGTGFYWAFGLYMAFTLVWTVAFVARFMRPPSPA